MLDPIWIMALTALSLARLLTLLLPFMAGEAIGSIVSTNRPGK